MRGTARAQYASHVPFDWGRIRPTCATTSKAAAREYGFTDVDGSQPDCWRYMVEVQDAGLPADPTGYR